MLCHNKKCVGAPYCLALTQIKKEKWSRFKYQLNNTIVLLTNNLN